MTDKPLRERIEQGCLTVYCPVCRVGQGRRCQTPSGVEKLEAHTARFDLASACNAIPIV